MTPKNKRQSQSAEATSVAKEKLKQNCLCELEVEAIHGVYTQTPFQVEDIIMTIISKRLTIEVAATEISDPASETLVFIEISVLSLSQQDLMSHSLETDAPTESATNSSTLRSASEIFCQFSEEWL